MVMWVVVVFGCVLEVIEQCEYLLSDFELGQVWWLGEEEEGVQVQGLMIFVYRILGKEKVG